MPVKTLRKTASRAVMNKKLFQNAVLAILKARPGMGSLQLRKALIIADALHNAIYGKSITGAAYIKQKYGPVPDTDEAFLCLMQMEFPLKLVEVIEEPVGYVTQNAYHILKEPEYELFSREQIDIINYAAKTAWKYSAARLSGMTHDDVYNNTPMGAEIPLDVVCKFTLTGYDTEPFTEREKSEIRGFLETDEARMFDFV
jgi:hypothetical protein